MIMLINITIIINMDNMNDFSNDNIISFLLNQFPKETPLGKNIERYTDSSSSSSSNSFQPPKPEVSFMEKVLDFLKKYWFFFFVFFLILMFIIRKRVSKK